MKVSRAFSFLCFSILLGCTRQVSSQQVVLQVNDEKLTVKEFAEDVARRLKDLDSLAAKDPQILQNAQEEILKKWTVRFLLKDWAKAQKIEITDKALDKEAQLQRAQFPDDASFRGSLAQENLSLTEWRENLRTSLLEKAVFQKLGDAAAAPSEQEIKVYFEENKTRYAKKERIFLRQIVVADEAQAELLKEELKKKPMADLAKKYSITPESATGGLVGWIEKGTVDFFDPLFSLPLNSNSKIFKSPYGYHIAKIEKKLPANAGSLDEARPMITKELKAQKEQALFMNWLDRQIKASKISRNKDLIRALKVETK